jgi:endonuclease/exonuclease/phosphatase family metal-dependent hydrolase
MTGQTLVDTLHHDLVPYFPELARHDSTKALKQSPLYRKLQPEIDRLLHSIVQEDLAPEPFGLPAGETIRATAWNIERGIRLDGIIDTLTRHPVIRHSDIFLLNELDYGMARSGNRLVAHEIAAALRLNYVFAPSYLNLSKGAGLEQEAAGKNTQALHGNAVFSRYPLRAPASFGLPNAKDKMSGREKRLGTQRAVIATVEHPLGPVRVASVHLDAHSTQQHRKRQMARLLDHLETLSPALPVLLGGDWNTSTYNSHHALYAIVGFWRRVLMGVRYTMDNHYARPDRWFERPLFRMLERRGYAYRHLNEEGACTLHYHVLNIAQNSNMFEWIPRWCYRFIDWSLKDHNGLCSFKLDWFAGRGVTPGGDPPRVIGGLQDEAGGLSDHDAIVLDFVPTGQASGLTDLHRP